VSAVSDPSLVDRRLPDSNGVEERLEVAVPVGVPPSIEVSRGVDPDATLLARLLDFLVEGPDASFNAF
jgi:hypothetical protein